MWRDGQKTNDYKFIDKRVSEMFTVGGTSILLHKYLGPATSTEGSNDATQPSYDEISPTNIQDMLFMENRDRKYDPDVYVLRGIYQRSDSDFDLSQFGLFLNTGTLFMTFHYNDMLERVGRKIMNGDVLELMHLRDDNPLDTSLTFSLKRYFVVSDASWSAEGFSPTWFPHLWRVKLNPLVDSQEYADILNTIKETDNTGPGGTPGEESTLGEIVSTYDKFKDINEAIVQQAELDVPLSGYDTSKLYTKPLLPDGEMAPVISVTADDVTIDNTENYDASASLVSPDRKIKGYLSGDGLAPNGLPVGAGIAFPSVPELGDYFLRLDYMPNRLFRFDGSRWVKIEDNVRTNVTSGSEDNLTLRNSFANNSNTTTLSDGREIPESQMLNTALRPPKDY